MTSAIPERYEVATVGMGMDRAADTETMLKRQTAMGADIERIFNNVAGNGGKIVCTLEFNVQNETSGWTGRSFVIDNKPDEQSII